MTPTKNDRTISNFYPDILVCLSLVLSTIAVYFQVVDFEFVDFDDRAYITNNAVVLRGLTLEGLKWAFFETYTCNWHPLTWVSHMLDIQMYGLDSGAHHLINLYFHLANTLLLYVIFKKMTESVLACGFIAALFALHPLHVESVAWVAERKDLLCAFFWMLTILSYIGYVEHSGKWRYMGTLFLFVLGLMAKPMIVTLPFVLLLLDFWPLQRFSLQNSITSEKIDLIEFETTYQRIYEFIRANYMLVLEKTPFIIFSLASCIITIFAQKTGGAVSSLANVPIGERIGNALTAYIAYIYKLVWPFNQAVFYPFSFYIPFWQITGAIFCIVIISLLSIIKAKRHPYLAVGWFWYTGTLIPVIGLVQVGLQSMADRYTYLPFIGLFIMLTWGFKEIIKKYYQFKFIFIFAIAVILTVLAMRTYHQVGCWEDSIALFERGLCVKIKGAQCEADKHPLALPKNQDRGIKKFADPERFQTEMKKFTHDFLRILFSKNHNSLKIVELKKQIDTSILNSERNSELQKLLNVRDGLDYHIRQYHSGLYYRQGVRNERKNKLDKAIAQYQQSLSIQLGFVQSLHRITIVYAKKGQYNYALCFINKWMHLQPTIPEVYYLSASIYARKDSADKAIEMLEAAVQKGFHDIERLKKDPNLKNIKHSKVYKEFISNYSKTQS